MAIKDTERILKEASETAVDEAVRGVCVSAASFIAEIDASSADVAAYLEQRFGPALRLAYRSEGRNVFRLVAGDMTKLRNRQSR